MEPNITAEEPRFVRHKAPSPWQNGYSSGEVEGLMPNGIAQVSQAEAARMVRAFPDSFELVSPDTFRTDAVHLFYKAVADAQARCTAALNVPAWWEKVDLAEPLRTVVRVVDQAQVLSRGSLRAEIAAFATQPDEEPIQRKRKITDGFELARRAIADLRHKNAAVDSMVQDLSRSLDGLFPTSKRR